MAKLHVTEIKDKNAKRPARKFRYAGYAYQAISLILQGLTVYLLLTK